MISFSCSKWFLSYLISTLVFHISIMTKEWICMILLWKLGKVIALSEDSRNCFPLKLINYWKSAEYWTYICSWLIFFCLLCHFPSCILELCFNYIAFIIFEFLNSLFLGLPLSLFLLTFLGDFTLFLIIQILVFSLYYYFLLYPQFIYFGLDKYTVTVSINILLLMACSSFLCHPRPPA